MLDNLKRNLKKNRGYYTLLAVDSIFGSVVMGVQFALLNPPLAIAIAVLNFGTDVAAGIMMAPKVGQTPEPALVESAAAVSTEKEKESRLKRAKGFYKKARKYQSSTFWDPDFVVKSTAAGAGCTLIFSTMLGMKSVLVTHSILFLTAVAPPVGIGVGAALLAVGLFGVIRGKHARWKGMSEKYTAAFREGSTDAPLKKARKTFVEKFAERPRMQKLLNSRWSKVTDNLVLKGMTLESAIFTLVAAPAVVVTHIAAMTAGPHAILTGAIPLVIALNWARGPVWHAICVGWDTTRDVLNMKSKIKEKKAAKENPAAEETAEPAPDLAASPAPEPAVEPVADPLDPSAEPLADMFEKVAGNDNTKDVLTTAAVSKTQEKTRKKTTGPGPASPDA